MERIVLASGSPRRRELLLQVGLEFDVITSNIEEVITKEYPFEVVMELSRQKAENVYRTLQKAGEALQDTVVIGADTVVYSQGKILGKPHNDSEAYEMIKGFQGEEHSVFTGVTLVTESEAHSFYEETKVFVYPMSDEEIYRYINTGEPSDKAGAYGIQGMFAEYVKGISGDYNNVVGLPLGRLCLELKNMGFMSGRIKNKYKACIFDLDGTVADSVEAIAHTANECLRWAGLKEHPVDKYKLFAGDGQFELIKRALRDAGDTELMHYDSVMERYIREFELGCTYQVKSFEGMSELLETLKNRNIRIAVLSNKRHPNTVRVVEKIYGQDFFDYILGQMDSYKKKPNPDGAFIVADKLSVMPEECLYIGDTNVDMQTGKRAGMKTVGVTWGFRTRKELEENHADYIVDSPKEILDIL